MPNYSTPRGRYKSFADISRSSYLMHQLRRHWIKPVAILAIGAVIQKKDLSIDLQFNARPGEGRSAVSLIPGFMSADRHKSPADEGPKAVNTSLLSGRKVQPPIQITEIQTIPKSEETPFRNVSQMVGSSKKAAATNTVKGDDNLANTYSNLGFEGSGTDAAKAAKRQKQLAYVKRYATVAQKEMEKFGIPASIKLAQGLLESNVGESRLAVHNNNHFGIKCFSRTCGKGHCSNFTDDSHKDFFRKYQNAWESYRSHSMLLQSSRYKHLKELKSTDYKGWAYGLKKAGYATDKNYAPKIINLIEDLKLHQYDK